MAAARTRIDPKSPDALDARQQLARSWGNFADAQVRARALGTARHFARESLKEFRKLVADSPSGVEFQLDLAGRLNQVAELGLLLHADPAEVDADLLKSRDVPQDDSRGPGGRSRQARGRVAASHALRAQLLADRDRPEAVQEVRAALDLLADLCADRPGVTVSPDDLVNHAAALALQAEFDGPELAAGRRKRAADALQRAADLQYRARHPDDLRRLPAFREAGKSPELTAAFAALGRDPVRTQVPSP